MPLAFSQRLGDNETVNSKLLAKGTFYLDRILYKLPNVVLF